MRSAAPQPVRAEDLEAVGGGVAGSLGEATEARLGARAGRRGVGRPLGGRRRPPPPRPRASAAAAPGSAVRVPSPTSRVARGTRTAAGGMRAVGPAAVVAQRSKAWASQRQHDMRAGRGMRAASGRCAACRWCWLGGRCAGRQVGAGGAWRARGGARPLATAARRLASGAGAVREGGGPSACARRGPRRRRRRARRASRGARLVRPPPPASCLWQLERGESNALVDRWWEQHLAMP